MRKKTGYIQDRGTSWRIAYYVDGIRHFESFSTEEEALRELAKRLSDTASGVPVSSKPNTVQFGELCADVINHYRINKHRSIDDIECRFRRHIIPVFGTRKACQITTAQLRAYVVHRQAKGATNGTINRELEAIRRAFLLAVKEKKLFSSPAIPMLKEQNTRTGFFTRAEVDKLCSFLKEPYRSFTLFGFLTGWRYSEIQGLQWRNVYIEANEIRLDPGTTKSGEGRVFPITPELRSLLEATKGAATPAVKSKRINVYAVNSKTVPAVTPFVFSIDGRSVGAFRKSWRTACIKAGFCIKDTNGKVVKVLRIFHDLRRSAARARQQEGFTEGQIMKMMGWKTRSVFDRYAIVTDQDIREKFEALNRARNGAKTEGQ